MYRPIPGIYVIASVFAAQGRFFIKQKDLTVLKMS